MKTFFLFLFCVSNCFAQFSLELIQSSNAYVFPISGKFTQDGRYSLVASKFGKIFQSEFINGELIKNDVPIIDKENEIYKTGEQGMLDIVLDPDFENNGFIYAVYCMKRTFLGLEAIGFNGDDGASILRVTQFQIDLESNSLINENVIIGNKLSNGIPILASNHVGASLNFDNTGALLITTGDGASGAYTQRAIQDGIIPEAVYAPSIFKVQQTETLNGKVLRVDKNTGMGLPDNPFWTGEGSDVESKIWGLGFRNPAFATYFNGALFIGNTLGFAPQAIHVQFEAAVNHGYPFKEGFDNFQSGNVLYPNTNSTFANFYLGDQLSYESINDLAERSWTSKPPLLDYSRTGGVAIPYFRTVNYSNNELIPIVREFLFTGVFGGGLGYISSDIYGENLQNSILFADFASNDIVAFKYDANYEPQEIYRIPNENTGITDIFEHPITKEIYILHYGSPLYKLIYDETLDVPQSLSGTDEYVSIFFNLMGQELTNQTLDSLKELPLGIYIEKRIYINKNVIKNIKHINN